MSKSTQAFKTIREVSELLDVKTHSLRFWESKFPQVRPVTRAGRRRYYRPSDIQLLAGLRVLIQGEQKSTKDVKAIFKDQGQDYVKDIGQAYLDQCPDSTANISGLSGSSLEATSLNEQPVSNELQNILDTQDLQQKTFSFQHDMPSRTCKKTPDQVTFFQVAEYIRADQYFKLPEGQKQRLILKLEALLERLNTEPNP